MKIEYNKKALSYSEQLEQLKSRGLLFDDEKRVLHYLSHINYYRLSAYLYPFLEDKSNHRFKEAANFQQVLDLYNFDRELRLLILDAIERIEISFRTSIIYVMSHKYDPFWICNKELFYNQDLYANNIQKLKEEIKRSDEHFLSHFFNKYKEEVPPSWISLEISSFGLLSLFFMNIRSNADRKEISNRYGLSRIVFTSWFHTIVYIRNICAHHARLWNKELSIQPVLPAKNLTGWLSDCESVRKDRIFIEISIILYFLNIINPSSHFKSKLHELLSKFPGIDLAPMGFPKDWKEENLFSL